MEYYVHNKPNYKMYFILVIIPVYVGLGFGKLYGTHITPDNMTAVILRALLVPWPVRITPLTKGSLGFALLIYAMICLYHISTVHNYMPGKEYGTARLAAPEELNATLMDEDSKKNKILSEHLRISTDTRKTGLNNNVLIIGGSGAGKTFYVVKPNGYNCSSSFIFCDPKGELLRDVGQYLQDQGYRILVLNLVNMDESDSYNPFEYIRSDEDVVKLITNLIANTTPKDAHESDPFWTKAESMYLQAIMYYVWYEYPKQGKTPNFRGVLDLLNKAKIPENEKELSELDVLMYALPEDHPALINYNKVRRGATDTVRSIIISANSRLAYMQNEKVLRILDHDDVNIPWLGEGALENPEKKTALFAVIPDNDKSYNFIVGMLYTQVFQELYYCADHKHGGRLPIPVAFWMDEFANVALPDGFTELLSTMRSREISCNIIIQNLAQLKTLFKDSWETVTGNCDVTVYLGGNEQSTHKYVSEMLGKYTIDKKSSGETMGSHGSASRNIDVLGRDLMSPDEVRKLDNRKCLIFVKGYDPVLDDKYRTYEKDEFRRATAMGPYKHHFRMDDLREETRRSMYLDSPEDKYRSYYYQVEDCFGLFEESQVFTQYTQETAEGYTITTRLPGYEIGDSMNIVRPVFSKEVTEYVRSGKNTLKKHELIGYVDSLKCTIVEDEEQLKEIFNEAQREAVPAQNA